MLRNTKLPVSKKKKEHCLSVSRQIEIIHQVVPLVGFGSDFSSQDCQSSSSMFRPLLGYCYDYSEILDGASWRRKNVKPSNGWRITIPCHMHIVELHVLSALRYFVLIDSSALRCYVFQSYMLCDLCLDEDICMKI